MTVENPPAIEALEALLDRSGLGNLVEDLATICAEKAEHIQSSYAIGRGPDALAERWRKASRTLLGAVSRLEGL